MHLRCDPFEPRDDIDQDRLGLVAAGRREDLAERGADHLLLGFLHVVEHVSEEVHRAALPGHAEHLPDRILEALVGIRNAEQHTAQAAGNEAAQEVAPEALRLGLAHIEADHLAAARLV